MSATPIAAAKIDVAGMNAFHEAVVVDGSDTFTLLVQDVHIQAGEIKQTSSLLLPDNTIRDLKMSISSIVFEGGPVREINTHRFVQLNYIEMDNDTRQLMNAKLVKPVYKPVDAADYWLCSCGSPNQSQNVICAMCSQNKEELFKLTSQESLDALAERRRIELEKADKDKLLMNQKQKKQKKRIIIAVAVLFVFVVTCSILYFGFDEAKYYHSLLVFRDGQYSYAKELMQVASNHQKAEEQMQKIDYEYDIYIDSINLIYRYGSITLTKADVYLDESSDKIVGIYYFSSEATIQYIAFFYDHKIVGVVTASGSHINTEETEKASAGIQAYQDKTPLYSANVKALNKALLR